LGFSSRLLWLVIASALAAPVHDFMILVGSIRRKGKSLAEMARHGDYPAVGFCCRPPFFSLS